MNGPSLLPPGQQRVAEGKWPPIGERRPSDDSAPWTVGVAGLVTQPRTFTLPELAALPQVERSIDIHCVTRWSKLAVSFRGVLLADLLRECTPLPAAGFVAFVARSPREHGTSLPMDDALSLQALIVLSHQGAPLETVHGGPVRIVVPGRYFYKSLKWLKRIDLLAEDRLGYWEQEAGYHNTADPWLEQRYMTPQLDRREVQRLLASRDFSGHDLRSLSAADRDLSGLVARGALLRDADFRRANLCRADFTKANLSNAHFEGADLRDVSFVEADLEGADFTAADLRGANFQGAALTAASFHTADRPAARIDHTTRIPAPALEDLMPAQAAWVRSALQ